MVLSFPTTLPSADFASNWASQEELAQPFTLWYRRDALRYFRGHQLNVRCYICIRSFPSLITQSPVIRALNSHDKKTISIGGRSLQGWLSKTELWCQQISIDHRVLPGIFAKIQITIESGSYMDSDFNYRPLPMACHLLGMRCYFDQSIVDSIKRGWERSIHPFLCTSYWTLGRTKRTYLVHIWE